MNIIDYVKNSGDETFLDRKLNEADAFVFASLAFARFEDKNIIPTFKEPDKKIYIHEIPDEFIDEICQSEAYGKDTASLIRAMKEKPRYKDISLQYQFSVIDEELTEQIYAITLNIPNVGYFISFRGTDGTTIGWSENFKVTINQVSAAQLDSIEYVNIVHGLIGDTPFMLGGHSKGGNLAFFASLFVDQKIQNLIVKTYFFEGQGLPFKFYEKEQYKRIADRIVNIVPRDSITGEFFYTPKHPLVVFSLGKGLQQHNQFNWQIKGNNFYFINERNPNARAFHRASKIWLKKGNKENFDRLIKLFTTITYIEGNENFISTSFTFSKFFSRFKKFRKELKFKERVSFYFFALRMYLIYRDSEKYYKKKDKEIHNYKIHS